MNAKTQTGETQTVKDQTVQTTKDAEELELTKDYLANRITRSYYTATGFAQFFIRLNPWFDEVTDIYAFFNPEDTYKDKYNQVCAKIIGLLLWKEGDKSKDIRPKYKYVFIPHQKLISLIGDQPIIKYKESYNRHLFKPSETNRWAKRIDAPLHYISIKLEWKLYTTDNGKTIRYYPSEVYTIKRNKIDKMVRDHEIVVDKENNTTEIIAGFNCDIIDFESEDFTF